MKRSQINKAVKESFSYFTQHGWSLPPNPRWDVTDFGLGDFSKHGLILVNLAEEEEYCEKLMFAYKNQITPAHTHKKKKEDIICRTGKLAIQVWSAHPDQISEHPFELKKNGEMVPLKDGEIVRLNSGERITLTPGIYHEFYPESEVCIIGEVSTANDDLNDNFFVNDDIGRFSEIEEDETPVVKLLSD